MRKRTGKTSVGDPWHFSATPDPYPTPGPTNFFSLLGWGWGWKKIFFSYYFYNLHAGTLSSVLKIKFLRKFCVKIFFCKNYFSPLNIFMRIGKDPDPGGPTGFATLKDDIKYIRTNGRQQSLARCYTCAFFRYASAWRNGTRLNWSKPNPAHQLSHQLWPAWGCPPILPTGQPLLLQQ